MAYTEELQRLVEAKASMRQSIINKGVDVPEDAPIEAYAEFIRQITVAPTIDTSNPSFAELKKALATDDPASYFPVGTEIPDTYSGHSNPLIIAQYLNEANNSSYSGAVGAILIRKYVEPTSQQFGGSVDYASSAIKNFLDTTYLNNCSEALRSVISNVSVQYYNGSSKTTVAGKLFLMSAYEVCNQGAGAASYEGVMWDYWKQKTGLSAPDAMYTNNNGRIMKDRNGTAQSVWLRSRRTSSYVCFVSTSGSVSSYGPSNSFGVLPACFVAKD